MERQPTPQELVETHYKVCPRCQSKTGLYVEKCQVCGRQFNTKFQAAHDEKTQFVTGVPAQGTPPYAPPPPLTPPIPLPHVVAPSHNLLDELAEQYQNALHWQRIWVCCLLQGPIALVIWLLSFGINPYLGIFAFLFPLIAPFAFLFGVVGFFVCTSQKPRIRQRIAELGINSKQWAQPMEDGFRLFAYRAGAVMLIANFVVFGSLFLMATAARERAGVDGPQVRELRDDGTSMNRSYYNDPYRR